MFVCILVPLCLYFRMIHSTFFMMSAQPSLTQDLPNKYDVVNNDSLSVSCSFKAKPAASITWIYEDNSNLPEAVTYTDNHVNVDRVYTQTTSTLSWRQQVALDDPRRREARGRYTCHAANNVGYTDSNNMELNVLCKFSFCIYCSKY